jgi:hypothetical protein
MDPREIVRRSIATLDLGSKTGRNYSYTERDVGRHLDASGVLQSEEVDVSKTIFVNGDPFQDLVEHNGAPPTPSEARKQMEKLLKRQTETKAERAARLENEKADRAFVTEVADAFNFKLVGEDVINGRPAYMLDVTPVRICAAEQAREMFRKSQASFGWINRISAGRKVGGVIEPFSWVSCGGCRRARRSSSPDARGGGRLAP